MTTNITCFYNSTGEIYLHCNIFDQAFQNKKY